MKHSEGDKNNPKLVRIILVTLSTPKNIFLFSQKSVTEGGERVLIK